MLVPELENELLNSDFDAVIGIDEAGRGAWAGPVAVGYYIFRKDLEVFEGVNDSKKLSPRRRAEKYDLLIPHGGVEYPTPQQIDRVGIGGAITDAIFAVMHKSGQDFPNQRIHFLIDGYFACEFEVPHTFVTKGDSKHYSIAAASILAKHGRDTIMQNLHQKHPQYGFDKHKGYGTAVHKQSLLEHGASPQHRYSYAPVKQTLSV